MKQRCESGEHAKLLFARYFQKNLSYLVLFLINQHLVDEMANNGNSFFRCNPQCKGNISKMK